MTGLPDLRVMTWNIHGCVGRDGRHDVGRIGDVLSDLAPDIAAFQEVDNRRGRHGHHEIQDYLCQHIGDHGHVAWALTGADGSYGQLIASRLPLHGRQVHDISVGGLEPRKVLEAVAELPGGALRVIATHLGVRVHERRRQLKWLREIVLGGEDRPTLMLGDFNGWRRYPRPHGPFRLFDQATRHLSFPSGFPLLPLDRIFCRGGARLRESRAVREARAASDHLPIVARLSLPQPE